MPDLSLGLGATPRLSCADVAPKRPHLTAYAQSCSLEQLSQPAIVRIVGEKSEHRAEERNIAFRFVSTFSTLVKQLLHSRSSDKQAAHAIQLWHQGPRCASNPRSPLCARATLTSVPVRQRIVSLYSCGRTRHSTCNLLLSATHMSYMGYLMLRCSLVERMALPSGNDLGRPQQRRTFKHRTVSNVHLDPVDISIPMFFQIPKICFSLTYYFSTVSPLATCPTTIQATTVFSALYPGYPDRSPSSRNVRKTGLARRSRRG